MGPLRKNASKQLNIWPHPCGVAAGESVESITESVGKRLSLIVCRSNLTIRMPEIDGLLLSRFPQNTLEQIRVSLHLHMAELM